MTTSALLLCLSGDFYQCAARVSVTVDNGQPQTFSISSSHAQGQAEPFVVAGPFDNSVPHQVVITFKNDAYDGSPMQDRNAYVLGCKWGGQFIACNASLMGPGQSATIALPALTAPVPAPPAASRLLCGVYCGDQTNTLANYIAWMGQAPDLASVHGGQASPSDMESVDYDMWVNNLYGNEPTQVCVTIPNMFDGDSLANTAAGLNDATLLIQGQKIVNQQDTVAQSVMYLRIDQEFNGGWMDWTIQVGNQADSPQRITEFVAAWQRSVGIYRSADPTGKLRIVWCPNIAQNDPEPCYPGDAYVDVIGLDFYWQTQFGDPADPVAAFNFMRTRPFGLDWLVAFGKAHGKPVCIPEWGICQDSPQYILLCLQYFLTNGFLYQNYWESNAAYAGLLEPVNGASQYPNAAAAYKTAVLAIMAGATQVCDAIGNLQIAHPAPNHAPAKKH